MVLLAQFGVFVLALAGILAGAIGALFFAGGALNKARPREFRIRRGGLALLCLCGIVASAATGFVGIGAIMYFAQQ